MTLFTSTVYCKDLTSIRLSSGIKTDYNKFKLSRVGFDDLMSNGSWGIKLGVSFEKSVHGEISLIKTDMGYGKFEFPANVIAIGTEYSWQRDQFILGPKISYEINPLIATVRLSFVYYTDFNTSDPRLIPEIGLSMAGFINVLYGRAMPLSTNHFSSIGKNRITLSFNLTFD